MFQFIMMTYHLFSLALFTFYNFKYQNLVFFFLDVKEKSQLEATGIIIVIKTNQIHKKINILFLKNKK